MSMKKWGNITTSVGEYKDRDGKQKRRYITIGTVFQDSESGRMSAHLDALPTNPQWDGWIALWEDDRNDRNDAGFSRKREEDSDLPF